MKKDDNIYVVNPPKKQTIPILADLAFKGLENPTVIPKRGALVTMADFPKKVRGKPLIEILFGVNTVKLRYRNRVWQEETQFTLHIPLRLAEKLGTKLVEKARNSARKASWNGRVRRISGSTLSHPSSRNG